MQIKNGQPSYWKLSVCKSGRQDSNLRPPGPKPGALPGCATPRCYLHRLLYFWFASAKVLYSFYSSKFYYAFFHTFFMDKNCFLNYIGSFEEVIQIQKLHILFLLWLHFSVFTVFIWYCCTESAEDFLLWRTE